MNVCIGYTGILSFETREWTMSIYMFYKYLYQLVWNNCLNMQFTEQVLHPPKESGGISQRTTDLNGTLHGRHVGKRTGPP